MAGVGMARLRWWKWRRGRRRRTTTRRSKSSPNSGVRAVVIGVAFEARVLSQLGAEVIMLPPVKNTTIRG